MELPVIGGRGAATTDALVRAVRKGHVELSRMVAGEEETIDGAVAFVTPGGASGAAANCARDVHCPKGQQIGRVLDGIVSHFQAHHAVCALLAPTAARFDEAWRSDLERLGFTPRLQSLLLMGAGGKEPDAPPELQVISARAAAPAYRGFLEARFAEKCGSAERAKQAAASEAGFLDADALDVLVARRDGRVVGCIGAVTVAEFGILRGLHLDPDAGRASVTEALLWHVLDLARRSQFRQVIAAVDESDGDALAAFGSIGMVPIETIETYVSAGVEISP